MNMDEYLKMGSDAIGKKLMIKQYRDTWGLYGDDELLISGCMETIYNYINERVKDNG